MFKSHVRHGTQKDATETAAEIRSAIFAIKQAKRLRIRKIRINTDSEVLCNAVSDLIPKWKSNGWLNLCDGITPIENRRDFEELDEVIRAQTSMDIKFKFIPVQSKGEKPISE